MTFNYKSDDKYLVLAHRLTRTSGRSAPIVLVPGYDQDKLNVTNIEVCA